MKFIARIFIRDLVSGELKDPFELTDDRSKTTFESLNKFRNQILDDNYSRRKNGESEWVFVSIRREN